MKPSIIVIINGPTEFTPIAPVLRILSERKNVVIRMFATEKRAIDLSKELSVELIDEHNLFNLLEHRSTGLLFLAADTLHPWHCLGHRCTNIARANKIPSLSVQHGLFLNAKDPLGIRSFTADKMAVWGPTFKEILVREGGIKGNRLIVTGNPYFDGLMEISKDKAKIDLSAFIQSVKSDDRVVLIATASHYLTKMLKIEDDVAIEFMKILIKGCLKDDIFVIVKPHPSDGPHGAMSIYNRALEELNKPSNVMLANSEVSTHSLLALADVVVSQASTVVYEALIKGKSVACFNLTDMPNVLAPLAQIGNNFINITSPLDKLLDNVSSSVEQLLSNSEVLLKESGLFSRDLKIARQGNSAIKVAQLALDMVHSSSKLYSYGRNVYRLFKQG